jgi:AraC family transcriptional regulator, exoenzyme S synthesis regulatory protein ExsA
MLNLKNWQNNRKCPLSISPYFDGFSKKKKQFYPFKRWRPMHQFPQDIIPKFAHIKAMNPNLLAVYIPVGGSKKTLDILQTMHCLEYIIEGTNTVRMGGFQQKVAAKEFHFRKKGNYQLETSHDYTALLFFFENDFINYFLEKHDISTKKEVFKAEFPPFHFKGFEFIDRQAMEVLSIIQKPIVFSPCLIELSFHQILLQITSKEPTRTFINFLKFTASHYKIDLAFFMEQHFMETMDLPQMAERTGRSVSSFKKDFHIIFGQTPFKWLLNRRLGYAHYLIQTTSFSLSEIADKCGIKNTSHFSKAYKNKFKIAPRVSRLTTYIE